MIPNLKQACTPRESVFNASEADTVYSLDDLGKIDANAFFQENFVTSGMKTLLTSVFSRMDRSNPDANGAFLLSQSMGGGKTHNLLALALLAKDPTLRRRVMEGLGGVGQFGSAAVLTFSGRENPEYGIWGELAKRLGREQMLSAFYQPLKAPGESDWIRLLTDDQNILILIDELPPYLNQSLQVSLGQSTLAHATQSALSNLLAAINSGRLPNVTLVLTDLSGSAYSLANDRLASVLSDMQKEAQRTVQVISPVRLDTPELYDILRTRLFCKLPDEADVSEVAAGFRSAIEAAGKALDVPTDRADDLQNAIRQTYPFHPSVQDIFARFRENQGYQQTRALIRIMRQVVAGMWQEEVAAERYLVGVHDFDTANPRLYAELEKINDRFGNAIAHDISNETRTAVAQQVDGPEKRNAKDVARLVLMSSLSSATDPVLGLTRADIITFLAGPNRAVAELDSALYELTNDAWYLHATADGRLLFRTTENVRARLESSVRNVVGDAVDNEIAKRLGDLFKPALRDVYQQVEALPRLKDVLIKLELNTLVIAKPESQEGNILRDFYDSLQYKNRVMFVTSRQAEYGVVVDRMRYLIAARALVKEFEHAGYSANDPQLSDARDLAAKYESNFYQALREAFFTLLSPSKAGLIQTEFNPEYSANRFEGEAVIRQALMEKNQYVEPGLMMDEQFRTRIEKQLWPADHKTVAWSQLKTEAAQSTEFPIHNPGKLEDVRDQAVQRGHWRLVNEGRYVERGPFEEEKAKVSTPRPIGEPDEVSGAVTLEVKPINADQVWYVSPSGDRQLVHGGKIQISDLSGEFVAVDTTGKHESDEPLKWANTIRIRHRPYQNGTSRKVELKAVPPAAMKYTIDGSSPLNAGLPYTGPFAIADEATTIRVIAEAGGVRSEIETFNVPAIMGDQKVTVDELKPATWRRRMDAPSTAETYELLMQFEKHGARLAGIDLTAESNPHYSSWSVDAKSPLGVAEVREVADLLMKLHQGWELRLEVSTTSYPTGADLLAIVSERKTQIEPNELDQA